MNPKLTLNTRDELLVIDTERIAYMQADGNYTHIFYMVGERLTVSLGLTKMVELLASTYPSGSHSPFYRLGRSLIINQRYLQNISLPRQKLILADGDGHRHDLTVHKAVLKEYRPVENVSWMDCKDFITRLNRFTGSVFRLPHENEWEYAAKGGRIVMKQKGFLQRNRMSKTKYSGCDSEMDLEQYAWYDYNAKKMWVD